MLADLGLQDRPRLLVWNKGDAASPLTVQELIGRHGGVGVSAMTGQGLDELLERVEIGLFRSRRRAQQGSPEATPS